MSDDAAREAAYATLAVANPNPPLRAEDVGYIELVSSPDPRVAPMIFALEHTKVRVGRYSAAGTYATSSDVYVAVGDDAVAISPMNTMFEHINGAFHAFDTRSKHGTYVNGDMILKRRALAPGDVIDIGGADGARVIFHGKVPPHGRPIRRAPAATRHAWHSPRSGLMLEIESAAGTASGKLDMMGDDWTSAALETAARVAAIASPALPRSAVDGGTVRYAAGEALTALPARWVFPPTEAALIVADVCDAAAACHRARPEIVVGPFDRGLVWRRANGRAVLLGAGLARIAYKYDQGLRGATMTMLHFRTSPEEIMGRPVTAATDAYYAAYLFAELVTGGEPYPMGRSSFGYLAAVKNGTPELPDGFPSQIASAFSPDPTARPSLAALAAYLRG